MPYTPFYVAWEDDPSQDTPIIADALNTMDDGIGQAQADIDAHIADGTDAHDASAISILDSGANYAATEVESALAEVMDAHQAHLADGTDAHDASAISVTPAGTISSTDVQAALQELEGDIIAGGIPSTIVDAKGDLVGATADNVPAAVAAATADGLVLTSDAAQATGVKWATPASGAAAMPDLTDVEAGPPLTGEAPVYDGAEFIFTNVATQAELDNHINDTSDAHDASAISVLDTAAQFTGTDVETVLAEIQDNLDAHLADTTDAHDASAVSVLDSGAYFTGTDVEAVLQEIGPQLGGGGTPTGVVAAYAGSAAPSGWLMCDGATASTATYPDLYALIGATYGATGSGYFTLPDLRGRIPVGKGTHVDVDALGDSDGVTAVGTRRPKHAHTVTDPGHAHTISGTWVERAGASYNVGGGGNLSRDNTLSAASNTTGISVGSSGMTDTPAYLVLNYIIKT